MPIPLTDSEEIRRWRDLLLVATSGCPADEAETVERIAALEALKSAVCATQADLAVTLDHQVRTREAVAGVPARRRGRGVASQIALARQESPQRAKTLLGFARDLHIDLPHTRTALAEGRLNEYRAMIVAAETGCLQAEDRGAVDEAVCGDPSVLHGLGTRTMIGELRRRTYAADPASVVRRARKAETERRVTTRPAPDTMVYLTALLPVGRGIAAFAALTRDADTRIAAGDARTKGQIMADLLVERLTGQATADAVPVTIDLVISDETLFGAGNEPADMPGHGPVPAQVARELVAKAFDAQAPTWLRTLYTDPTGRLVAMTSKQRFAPVGLSDFIKLRDAGICRTPWCDAPIRHNDHITTVAEGGTTDQTNLQGLCQACNHAKQAPGWSQRTIDGERHTVETTTPTGHRHRSPAPTPPTPARPPTLGAYPLEIVLADVYELRAA